MAHLACRVTAGSSRFQAVPGTPLPRLLPAWAPPFVHRNRLSALSLVRSTGRVGALRLAPLCCAPRMHASVHDHAVLTASAGALGAHPPPTLPYLPMLMLGATGACCPPLPSLRCALLRLPQRTRRRCTRRACRPGRTPSPLTSSLCSRCGIACDRPRCLADCWSTRAHGRRADCLGRCFAWRTVRRAGVNLWHALANLSLAALRALHAPPLAAPRHAHAFARAVRKPYRRGAHANRSARRQAFYRPGRQAAASRPGVAQQPQEREPSRPLRSCKCRPACRCGAASWAEAAFDRKLRSRVAPAHLACDPRNAHPSPITTTTTHPNPPHLPPLLAYPWNARLHPAPPHLSPCWPTGPGMAHEPQRV